jgi:acetylornithine deacetylase/succinyl-diaminopimelate desuccinylase-like protein
MANNIDFNKISRFIFDRAKSTGYREYMKNLLCELIDIDTTTSARPLPNIVAGETRAFDVLEKSLKSFVGSKVSFEKVPIDPAIENHPYYTKTYYTANERFPLGLPAAESYKNRFNLIATLNPEKKSENGKPVLLNAHMDTVSPFYPSKTDEKYVHGRGACDDKGSVVYLAAAMKLLLEVIEKFGPIPMKPIAWQFVIEEEPGGNGSLSIALDKRFQGYEAIVGEATLDVPFPANRGAMWFQLNLNCSSGVNFAEIIPFIIYEFSREGRKLRDETNLPLFPKDYVQVNLGSLNSFGAHPSAVNDYLGYDLTISHPNQSRENLTESLHAIIDSALKDYTLAYHDRTKETDPETGSPKLKQHYALTPESLSDSSTRFKLEIFGVGGHMGAMLLRDNALIKTGFIMQALIHELKNKPQLKADFKLAEKSFNPTAMTMTGGVGFTPAHKMSDLKVRLLDAVKKGIHNYNKITGSSVSTDTIRLTFDKLHNEAYASPLDCPSMKAFKKAYELMNIPWPTPIAWRASCDSRIYGNNGYNTITFGPGDLADAHSDHEKISFESMQRGLEMITLTVLSLVTGEYK